MKIFKNVKLKNYTTFRIGGKASLLMETNCYDDILRCYENQKDTPKLILGAGSNVLVSDNGFDGLVIIAKNGDIKIEGSLILADAGVKLPTLSKFYMDNNFKGLEWACAIPGSVGGAVKMNSGAFESDISNIAEWVEVLRDDKIIRLKADECGFAYRYSGFLEDDIILRAAFKAEEGDKKQILMLRQKYNEFRKKTQPSGFCAGSVFKGADKPAGWYIDNAGLKGTVLGGARISDKHANFIINIGFATAQDVRALIDLIKAEVFVRYNVELKEELKYIGEF